MFAILGNKLAVILILVLIITSFFFPREAAMAFIVIIYLFWLLLNVYYYLEKPSRESGFGSSLSDAEYQLYRRYFLSMEFPSVATTFSAMLNLFRVAGVVWGAACLWQAYYYLGGAMIIFFLVSSALIVRLNPYLYLLTSNNSYAAQNKDIFQSLIERYKRF